MLAFGEWVIISFGIMGVFLEEFFKEESGSRWEMGEKGCSRGGRGGLRGRFGRGHGFSIRCGTRGFGRRWLGTNAVGRGEGSAGHGEKGDNEWGSVRRGSVHERESENAKERLGVQGEDVAERESWWLATNLVWKGEGSNPSVVTTLSLVFLSSLTKVLPNELFLSWLISLIQSSDFTGIHTLNIRVFHIHFSFCIPSCLNELNIFVCWFPQPFTSPTVSVHHNW